MPPRWQALGALATLALLDALAQCGAHANDRFFEAAAVSIMVGSAAADPGGLVTIDVTLSSPAGEAAGIQNNIRFAPELRVVSCVRNETIGKEGTIFSFRPRGCQPEKTCDSVTALVFSIGDSRPVPDGAVLYSCTVRIAEEAEPGSVLPLMCANNGASNGRGTPLPSACVDGAVHVVAAPCAGDCDGDGRVSINELVFGVGLVLGDNPLTLCPAFDQNGDAKATVADAVTAVNRSLQGCGSS